MALSGRDFIDRHDNGAQEDGRLPISGRDFDRWRNRDAQRKWPMADGRYRVGTLTDGAIGMHKGNGRWPMADIADGFVGSGLGLLIA